MKTTKKVMISGLAAGSGPLDKFLKWGEVYDIEKLEKLALEGWVVTSIKGMSYRLIKTEPTEITYAFDYVIKPREDYFELIQSQGWEHIQSLDYVHMFKAPLGTAPFHSSKEVKADVLATVARLNFRNFWIVVALSAILQLILNGLPDGTPSWIHLLGNVMVLLGVISALFYIISGIGFHQRKKAALKE